MFFFVLLLLSSSPCAHQCVEAADNRKEEIHNQLDALSNAFVTMGKSLASVVELVDSSLDYFEKNLRQVKSSVDRVRSDLEKCGCTSPGKDCADLYQSGIRDDGVYSVRPLGSDRNIQVYCDMNTDGGGWTVFQKRGDFGNSEDYFYKSWDEYKNGFGEPLKEFWLGNDNIYELTKNKDNQLRIDLWDLENTSAFATYNNFYVENESNLYKIGVEGYSGNAGDSLTAQNNRFFSTKDRDNDDLKNESCAELMRGAWWFLGCSGSDLNGLRLQGGQGIQWMTWKGDQYSLPRSEMKIRPRNFTEN